MTSKLFSPLTIRGLTLRNRIVVSPMLTYSAVNGHASDWHLAHLAQFAAGGAGLVFMESTKIHPAGCSTPRDTGLWKDEFIPQMKRITALVKRNGAPIALQLGHSGRKARRSVPWEGRVPMAQCPGVDHGETWELIGPSAIPHGEKYSTPREMTKDDIRAMADAWAQGARRANDAGFDVLEIHGAHGYLIHQFLSPHANKRTDEYGGSMENRMRFAIEVVRAVRKEWPEEKPLFFRVSAVDETGWSIEDSVTLAKALEANGVDVFDCSSGGMSDGATASEQAPPYGYQVPYARDIRAGAGIMTMAVGMIVHSDHAEEIVASGSADLVAIGREMLHNPHWPIDAAQKLGVEAPFSGIPNAYAYFLDKRAQNKNVRPSTFGSS
ncbi:MAG TPA: NADH:flavin oxidoreductase/NADH oxidase [Burkholderiales bacterium]|nr:NADH:flavin oxidoreductase/NADH oxidase [Burkholderiales bacterium]